ncbi:hypothetical protein AGABI1DRAFT_131111 [Agaricus bisporus var. burnettii JB137-S8]|uniref:Sm domain-containing protein n=1 Tax=Agaricus bisporus var. burnettii (strain JB137-S8 / ATCC MYA-4627 / FGSC 10392) TaxID=597362 RepID=K5VPZ8_AGABU|nr:uncharacterized protein AGABI1DRAFT_131111 [Agaricus bisporus var. burnettii JB137-S8]EKM76554.1 hypothetical protein AGABI1DRAFT_131111 [Agaricus bisporus var. burnettii JB137-S8]
MADRNRPSVRGIIRGVPLHRPRGGPPPSSGLAAQDNKPKREAILDLAKYVNEPIRVKFMGGREVVGTLKGYDQLLNLVLDDVQEQIQGNPTSFSLFILIQPDIHPQNQNPAPALSASSSFEGPSSPSSVL